MDLNDIVKVKINVKNVQPFVEKYNNLFSFPELDENNLREELWTALFSYLSDKKYISDYIPCLSTIRVLSRDKTNLNNIIKEQWVDTLIQHSGLRIPENTDLLNLTVKQDYNIIIEALKCMCNLVFNSSVALSFCCTNGTLEGILKRILTYRDPFLPHDVKYFDIKLLFIITALNTEIRPKVREELHGIIYLIEILDVILKECSDKHETKLVLSDTQVNLSCEILKVLYNLTIKNQFSLNTEEDEDPNYIRLVILLHDFLLTSAQTVGKTTELQGHIVNLLTACPSYCLKELISMNFDNQSLKKVEFEGYNVEVLDILLEFLRNRLNSVPTTKGQNELLSPILLVLLNCASSSRIMRKYLRLQILPPLRDVHRRPEEGSTLRNYLCRMLTSPVTELRDLSAELLFILCKENASRMIKYTGYGNAAGLFANRGMFPARSNAEYSSDSEDSDTEEYKQLRHGINDVVGCYEPPRPVPTENMTEEQKEFEAMKLVELMHDLTEKGIIKPCKIDENGKPQPLDHVLQLQENSANLIKK